MPAVVPAPHAITATRRATHPWAWWCWAIGAAAAVSLTHNLALIVAISVAVTLVVLTRRSDAPWARAMGLYLGLAGIIVLTRLVFQITIGGIRYGTVLFTLPHVALPRWAAGIEIGGPVTLEGIVFTLSDAGRLAAMIICLGCANALANPRQALRCVPAALYEVSTALVIALSVAPQLVESAQRVARARRLRGGGARGVRAAGALIVPVLQDAVERSMSLAAGMESRGYGSTRDQTRVGHGAGAAMLASLALLGFGAFALLSLSDGAALALVSLGAGLGCAVAALRIAGRRLAVTRYRPSPWQAREFITAFSGLATLGAMLVLARTAPQVATPTNSPVSWPPLDPLMAVVVGLILVPIAVTTVPPEGQA
ncbi:energy-coupling factor transport system permease protein [Propionibacterium cyclohexanicum]|uniref:Energy-coupling factor transport system permease protein n=2 Tax=Propionibacterium cyclohexanicum TaxID=64702 RepID=A0A1H9S5M3_9ACTN|nr:energy-coupling factor transport system permease protein [Propionibacterium cyclohexanicum]